MNYLSFPEPGKCKKKLLSKRPATVRTCRIDNYLRYEILPKVSPEENFGQNDVINDL